jgi:hypothetical protein
MGALPWKVLVNSAKLVVMFFLGHMCIEKHGHAPLHVHPAPGFKIVELSVLRREGRHWSARERDLPSCLSTMTNAPKT